MLFNMHFHIFPQEIYLFGNQISTSLKPKFLQVLNLGPNYKPKPHPQTLKMVNSPILMNHGFLSLINFPLSVQLNLPNKTLYNLRPYLNQSTKFNPIKTLGDKMFSRSVHFIEHKVQSQKYPR